MTPTYQPSRVRAATGFGIAAALALAFVLLAPSTASALAQTDTGARGSLLVTEGPVEISAGDRIEAVVVTGGDATIAGEVDTILAWGGDILVTGQVDGTAVAFDGTVVVEPGARVEGDVYASQTPEVAEGTVGGEVSVVNFTRMAAVMQGVIGLLAWIAATIGLLILGGLMILLVPRAVAAARRVAERDVGLSALTGLVLAVALPVVGALIAVTIVGIPIALGLFAAAWLLGAAGYVVVARVVGGLILRSADQPLLSLVVGLLLLQVVGLIPVFGGLVTLLAAAYGLGVVAVATWRARSAPPAAAPAVGAPPAPSTPAPAG